MARRRWLFAGMGLLILAVVAAAAVVVVATRPADPLTVARAWVAARNAGDVDAAMSYFGETGNIQGIGVHLPGGREELRRIFAAQAIAGWMIEDHDCVVDGETVTCRYRMSDEPMRRWGLELSGEHTYVVRDGTLTRSARVHDPAARAAVYAASGLFQDWVREAHSQLYDVIWISFDSPTYSTPEGAHAVLGLLDEYDAVR